MSTTFQEMKQLLLLNKSGVLKSAKSENGILLTKLF